MTSATTAATTISQYERAAARAQANGIQVTGRGYRRADGVYVYTVSSASQPNVWHIVAVEDDALACDCPAGQHGRYCQHRALVHQTIERELAADRAARRAQIAAEIQAARDAFQRRADALREAAPLHRSNAAFSIWKDETQDIYAGHRGATKRSREEW